MSKRQTIHFDRQTNEFVGLDADLLKQLGETFPAVEVTKELLKMKIWMQNNPKGKETKGTINFIMAWLNRIEPTSKLTSVNEYYDLVSSDTPLGAIYREYLQELWKDREHIYTLNQINKLPTL